MQISTIKEMLNYLELYLGKNNFIRAFSVIWKIFQTEKGKKTCLYITQTLIGLWVESVTSYFTKYDKDRETMRLASIKKVCHHTTLIYIHR